MSEQPEEALPVFEATLALLQRDRGDQRSEEVIPVQVGLANAYEGLGRHEEALALNRELYFRRADAPQMGRGDAAAAIRTFRGDESRRRRGRDVAIRSRPARGSGTPNA